MELKVWVDGVQRVVCGITKQTTVQEVVIALAQATGRTGRYTLVEKSRNAEKMLPPSEYPIQVLTKWGERSNEIQFILRRTGASTVMNESGEEGVITPERTSYRQSLPPQLKHRQKNEAILNRKEPKRKSLTIPAAPGEGSNKYKSIPIERKNDVDVGKSDVRIMPGSPKKALIPPPFRNSPITSPKLQTSKQTEESVPVKKEALMPPSNKNKVETPLSPKKKPLIPPQSRFSPSVSRQILSSDNRQMPPADRTSISSDIPSFRQHSFQGLPSKPVVQTKSLESAKARAEFTRLVLEQQAHVNEQSVTLKNLGEEMEKYEAMMQRREQQAALLKKEIESLEKSIEEKDADLQNEQLLEGLMIDEGSKSNNLHNENSKFKLEVSAVDANIKELEKHILFLQEEIQQEQNIQIKRNQEMKSYQMEASELQLRRMNSEVRKAEAETQSLDDIINQKDSVVYEKQMQLEALNRELRQVNLQQFIRQTGSKVTVLPSDTDRHTSQSDYSASPATYDVKPEVSHLSSSNTDSGGVWV